MVWTWRLETYHEEALATTREDHEWSRPSNGKYVHVDSLLERCVGGWCRTSRSAIPPHSHRQSQSTLELRAHPHVKSHRCRRLRQELQTWLPVGQILKCTLKISVDRHPFNYCSKSLSPQSQLSGVTTFVLSIIYLVHFVHSFYPFPFLPYANNDF